MTTREVAWRVFAGEYNSSTYQYIEGGERAPSYLVTPLGAKINRVFVVGVVTDIENIGTDIEPMWRARLSDPTGVYYLTAGQYQPSASQVLSKIKPPAFVAVVGKTRVYSPEEGVIYLSIRPENVKEVSAELRDYWVLEACKSLRKRIEATREALQMSPPRIEELRSLGYGQKLSEGVVLAREHYKDIELEKYESMLVNALQYLLPEYQEEGEVVGEEVVVEREEVEKEEESSETEEKILELISSIDPEGKGAPWETLLKRASKEGVNKEALEETINALLDKGLVYEPILGKIKRI